MVTTHAFSYQLRSPNARFNRMVDLGVLGGVSSYGTAINDYNHIVGYSTISTKNESVHAFMHDGAKMIDLGSLADPETGGVAISAWLWVSTTTIKLLDTPIFPIFQGPAKYPSSKWAFYGAELGAAAGK